MFVRPIISTLALAATAIVVNASTASATPDTTYVAVVTATSGLAGRARPSRFATKVTHYASGKKIYPNCKVYGTAVGGNRLWYLIADHDSTQWVAARYLRNVGPAPDFCDPTDGSFAGRTTSALNKRQGPSTSDIVVGRLTKGARVNAICYTQVSPTKRWIYTASGHWVSGSYVTVSNQLRYCMN